MCVEKHFTHFLVIVLCCSKTIQVLPLAYRYDVLTGPLESMQQAITFTSLNWLRCNTGLSPLQNSIKFISYRAV